MMNWCRFINEILSLGMKFLNISELSRHLVSKSITPRASLGPASTSPPPLASLHGNYTQYHKEESLELYQLYHIHVLLQHYLKYLYF